MQIFQKIIGCNMTVCSAFNSGDFERTPRSYDQKGLYDLRPVSRTKTSGVTIYKATLAAWKISLQSNNLLI